MRIGIDAHLVKAQPTGVGKAITRTISATIDAGKAGTGTSGIRQAHAVLSLPKGGDVPVTGSVDDFVIYANRQFPRDLDARAGARVVRTPLIAASRSLRILHEALLMPRSVRRDRIDLFYAPGYVFPATLDVPLVLGIYDLNALKFPGLVKPETARYYKYALPASARHARLIIAPTHAVASDIEHILRIPPDRIRVVPLAADDKFKVAGSKSAELGTRNSELGTLNSPYVLFVGNIEPNKNLVRLVEAFYAARTHANLPHKLVIAGKRRHRARELLRTIRLLGCSGAVLFPGYVPDADLPALYAGADAFVYPSRAEGFGIPPLEAMLSGTPVITSTDPAVVEVTADGALHVPADNLPELRSAIERLLTDRAFAAELAVRGRRIAERYTWAETGHRTLAVLHEAAGACT